MSDTRNNYLTTLKTNLLNELRDLAQSNGFELLDTEWLGNTTTHHFKHIASGKLYSVQPVHIKRYGFPSNLRNDIDFLNELKELATAAGFELLDQEWQGNRTKYQFKHIVSGKLYSSLQNTIKRYGFPKDLRSKSDMYNDFKEYANTNGFELLTPEWLGGKKLHQFKHIESGKLYNGYPNNLLREGFPKDLRTNSDRYNDLKKYANENGFELLESEWLGIDTPHKFIHTASGKSYSGTPNNILKGFPVSFNYDFTMLTKLRQNSDKKGFDLLDSRWLGKTGLYRFKHRTSGQIYEGRPNANAFPVDILNQISRLNKLASFATKNGYELLDHQWLGENTEHTFKHIRSNDIYKYTPRELRSNKGFPQVDGQRYLTEEVCRQIMKHIFGGTFKSDRKRFKDPYGMKMQLDGYEKFDSSPKVLTTGGKILAINDTPYTNNLNITEIAFEFQGHQGHLENNNVIKRDALRVKYCQELGILLVVINPPEVWNKARDSDYMFLHVCRTIQNSIKTERPLQFRLGFEIDLSDWNPDLDEFDKLKALALEHNYELLDTKWQGVLEKHKFKHKVTGTLYERSPANIYKSGFITKVLTDIEKYENLITYAKKHGFELLEDKWLGGLVNHRFKHISSEKVYVGRPNTIQNHGFPKELRTKSEKFNDLYNYAQVNGFKLLEAKWLGSHVRHRFIHIESGQLYEGCPHKLVKGFPKDLRSDADRLQELSIRAQTNGLELCSPEWLGSNTKHRFKNLATGEVIERLPTNIKSKSTLIKENSNNITEIETLTEKIGNLFFDELPPAETFMPDTASSSTSYITEHALD